MIRPGQPSEAAALTELALRSKRSWGYDADFMRRVLPDMVVTSEDIERGYCIVAEKNGIACAYALASVDGNEVFLRDLFVDPPYFGQGHGSELFRRIVDWARSRGAVRLSLHSDPNSESFYERLGMRTAGEVPSIIGNGRTLPLMQLEL